MRDAVVKERRDGAAGVVKQRDKESISALVRRPHSLKNVPIARMRVNSNAQRALRPVRVSELAADFDLDYFGWPIVSFRDGYYYIIDGQHRVEALKRWLGDGWEKQNVECRVYTGLTERDEAKLFDHFNNILTVRAFDRFKIRVTGGEATESAVKRAVESVGLKISDDKTAGSVGATGALAKVYLRSDAATLAQALRIIYESFGDVGLQAAIIDGFGLLCQRYSGVLNETEAIEKFKEMRGGIGALRTRAEVLRKQTGRTLSQCIAAAAVDTLNSKRGGTKLPSWWNVE